jgi:UDP-glucuronate 4-epimerase
MDYTETPFEIFNLGESRTVELRELISLLEKNLGKPAVIERLPMQPGDMTVTFANIAKARRMLHYNPTTEIETGIAKFADWFKNQ